MGPRRRTILRFGLTGLVIAAGFFVYIAVVPLPENTLRAWIAVAGACFCPGFLLLVNTFCYVEVAQLTWSGLGSVFFFVAVTNCFLYGIAGSVYDWLRTKLNGGTVSRGATSPRHV
jgi:hypothetical protein